jgi:atypical dual specificity phosphatase
MDAGSWLEQGQILACAYPRREAAFAELRRSGISLLINLHEKPHQPDRLAKYGLVELHLPVKDFTSPSPAQLGRGIAAIEEATSAGNAVAVHCGGGFGRTGTLLACYLIHRGLPPEAAIARVRAARPGSIETASQVAAVKAYGQRHRNPA